jgi:O-antigen/teichoic acid export membrane protein
VAVVLAVRGHGVLAIMIASLVIGATGVLLQALAVNTVTGGVHLTPSWHRASMSLVFAFGSFSWFQALSAVALMHADRLLVGAYLGTAAVAYYSICVQAAQPIHGLSAAALNVIFPNITAKLGRGDVKGSQRVFRKALAVNILIAAALSIPLVFLGHFILTHWMGSAFASVATPVLRILAVAYAVLAVNVTGHYTLLALGKVRFVTVLNVIGGLATLGIAMILVGRIGLIGAAIARLAYGPVTLLYYWAAHTGILKHLTEKIEEPTGNSEAIPPQIIEAQEFV